MSTKTTVNYASKEEVRWCPGCGDYAILSAMQRFFKQIAIPPEQVVFVSGIGCNGRFPYYMNTFGFHTIHGRAPSVATGIKLMNPELSVWLITGDGDGLSIGTNHLIHTLRRDLDINIVLFNNQIYGLTKGQFSPTSVPGQKTKTTPDGVEQQPLCPLSLALSVNASFVARGLDKEPKHLVELFEAAYQHTGTSFIEIYQNCPVFNDNAFTNVEDKKTRKDEVIFLQDQTPLIFGVDNDKALIEEDGQLVANLKGDSTLIHEASNKQRAYQLCELLANDGPLPLGVLYQKARSAAVAEAHELDLNHLNKLLQQ